MKKLKLYCFFTPSHEEMFKAWLKPSALDEYDICAIPHEKQPSSSGEYRKDGWRETQYHKVLAWVDAVRENMGEVIVCCDTDVQFLKPSADFFVDFLHGDDIAFQQNDHQGKLCSGFFICRCSLQTLNFFEIVAKRLKKIMHEPGGGEQYVMQDLIDEGWLQLKIKMIPRDRVWNPGRKYEKVSDLDIPTSILAHHANWVEGEDKKIRQLEYVKSKILPYVSYKSLGSTDLKPQSELALCLSSLLRNFDVAQPSLIKNIIHTLPVKPDLFGHFPKESETKENLDLIEGLKKECNQSFIKFEEDETPKPEHLNFVKNLNAFQRHGIKGNILQWSSMKKVCEIKMDIENQYKNKYKCVIWSRPDLYFFNSLDNINNLNNHELWIPAHDNHFCGLFDRFCLGTSDIMNQRMHILDYFLGEWYKNFHDDDSKLFFNKRKGNYQWNPELVFKEFVRSKIKTQEGKLNLCSGKLRNDRFVKVPFWHEIHGNSVSGKICDEDIVNPEILRKIYEYEIVKIDKHGGWFQVKV